VEEKIPNLKVDVAELIRWGWFVRATIGCVLSLAHSLLLWSIVTYKLSLPPQIYFALSWDFQKRAGMGQEMH
jgi:hypothetical protein